VLAANTETLVTSDGLTAPALTAFASVRVEFGLQSGANLAAGNTLLADGVQLSPTDATQTYTDGSLGARFHWAGVAHLSASWRDAITVNQTRARNGVTHFSAELWLSNTDGAMLQNISETIVDGKVSANSANTIKTALNITSLDPDVVTPYASVVAPFAVQTDLEGNVDRQQLGLYITTPAKRSHRQAYSTGTIEGRGLEWILDNDAFGATYNLAAGVNYIQAVIDIISAKGLRYSIPASALTLPLARTWGPDKSKLDIINDLLNGAGYYTLWADRFGVLKSRPYFELANATPTLELYSGEGSLVIDVVEQEGIYDSVANQVIVYKENPSGTPIRVTRTNNDPSSPTSTVSLGRTITRVIKDSDIADVATAQATARMAIEQAASVTNKLRVTTLPVPARDLHEVYDLALYNADGKPVGFGLWWCDAWDMGFTVKSAKMTHQLKRLEPYGWSEVIG
jgi:hypothetical protein